jgi:hypothetical protein
VGRSRRVLSVGASVPVELGILPSQHMDIFVHHSPSFLSPAPQGFLWRLLNRHLFSGPSFSLDDSRVGLKVPKCLIIF